VSSVIANRSLTVAALWGLSFPVLAQQGQLPRKGRQPERVTRPPAEPVRKLPRKKPIPVTPGPAERLQAYIDEQRSRVQPQPRSEDRLRPLLKGAVLPLRPQPAGISPHALPKLTSRPVPVISSAGVEATPIRNRWRIFPSPSWRRYDDPALDAIYATSRYWDPFNRNTIKADYPFHGRREFFNFTGTSETLFEFRRVPVPSVASSTDPGEFDFFGRGGQSFTSQNFRLSFDLFRGSAGFRPVDWELRVTPEFNVNYLRTHENGLVAIDVRRGTNRIDTHLGMQELFFEKRLFTEKAHFDFTSLRAGIQRFTSDFRGFIFSDEQPGVRLFGTFHNNIFQYNLAYFNFLEKDTNSGLNTWRRRNQSVYAANMYWSDFIAKGYTLNFSLLYNNDQPSFLIDKNGFLARPAPIGMPVPHKIRAAYAGISGDGHIGRINVSHSFYQAFGRDDFNSIPAKNNPQHINAQLAAAEFSYEKNWMTYKASVFYTSGDGDINDGRGHGFDAIVPNQQFAGGGFLGNPSLADRGLINNAFAAGGINFLNREAIPLTGTGVLLFGLNSLMPTLRATLFEGQANFINPGILLFNAAFDAKVTPKLRGSININWAKFNRTEALEAVLFQSNIRHAIGLDTGIGVQYRPLLSDNIVVTAGFGALVPGGGFQDIYNGQRLFSGFVNVRMVF
jgi:hypothetical protein